MTGKSDVWRISRPPYKSSTLEYISVKPPHFVFSDETDSDCSQGSQVHVHKRKGDALRLHGWTTQTIQMFRQDIDRSSPKYCSTEEHACAGSHRRIYIYSQKDRKWGNWQRKPFKLEPLVRKKKATRSPLLLPSVFTADAAVLVGRTSSVILKRICKRTKGHSFTRVFRTAAY